MVRIALFVALLAGCTEKDWIECADGATDDRCPEDAGTDARMDGDDDDDAGECTDCPSDRPLCDEGECVACLGDDDCDGGRSCISNECVECIDDADCGEGVCVSRECVACREHADCTDPSESACDPGTGTCVACATSAQCAHLEGATVCRDARCVECTTEGEEETCGEMSCDPATNRCTATRRGSLGFCLPCASDTECVDAFRCVATTFQGVPHGDFCLRDAALLEDGELCPARQPSRRSATSVGGVSSDFCFPDPAVVTCEAVLDLREACGSDDECGAPDLDDGVCIDDEVCSYLCLGDRDCGSGSPGSCVNLGVQYCQP